MFDRRTLLAAIGWLLPASVAKRLGLFKDTPVFGSCKGMLIETARPTGRLKRKGGLLTDPDYRAVLQLLATHPAPWHYETGRNCRSVYDDRGEQITQGFGCEALTAGIVAVVNYHAAHILKEMQCDDESF